MRDYITQEEYRHIEALVDKALGAYTKAQAKPFITELEICSSGILGNTNLILSQLINSVKDASGYISDKENKKLYCMMELSKLRDKIKKNSEH